MLFRSSYKSRGRWNGGGRNFSVYLSIVLPCCFFFRVSSLTVVITWIKGLQVTVLVLKISVIMSFSLFITFVSKLSNLFTMIA